MVGILFQSWSSPKPHSASRWNPTDGWKYQPSFFVFPKEDLVREQEKTIQLQVGSRIFLSVTLLGVFLMLYHANTMEAHHRIDICLDHLQPGDLGFSTVQSRERKEGRIGLDVYYSKGSSLKREGLISQLKRLKGYAARFIEECSGFFPTESLTKQFCIRVAEGENT